MTERTIVDAAARLRRTREPYLIATVVNVGGSAYRRPGARLLLTRFRWIAGSVSGGCLEGDIAGQGWWRTQAGEPMVVRYDSELRGEDDDDDLRSAFGLGGDGIVDVMIERAGVPGYLDPLELAHDWRNAQRRGAVVTVFRSEDPAVSVGARLALRAGDDPIGAAFEAPLGDAMLADARLAIETGASTGRAHVTPRGIVEVFVEAIAPPPRVFVLGTGHDAVRVVELARAIGWDVSVCARQPKVATRERFVTADELVVATPAELAARIDACDQAFAIVMSHDDDLDRQYLGMLASTRARYIGVLGPRARTARLLGELALGDDSRIRAPVGLELAETPSEVALAAIAEIQSVLRRGSGGRARDRVAPVHDVVEAPFAVAV